ncbi:MAG TPA: DUF2179 domain-containing protein [Bacteroidales bacterium]|nr:DUF2179 domain-containing protein [Bacteroidales bacterium]HOE05515.1 DUF2179 domain-containing protein [Bacteroidales bacterium]HQL69779.1 DUF2179 domain-containing protein [Bacteroidales bacterium]
MSPDLMNFLVIPVLIFLARICDVTIGTIRIIMVARGKKIMAPILGFFEVFIWIIAVSKIMDNLDNWVNFVFYAAGFATGNYIGMLIEEKLAMGTVVVRIITAKSGLQLIDTLREKGFGLTWMNAQGREEQVNVIFLTVKRSSLKELIPIIHNFNPNAFYTIEDVRYVSSRMVESGIKHKSLFSWRKGK